MEATTFITFDPNHTLRERHLQRAEALAHASHVAHKTRKNTTAFVTKATAPQKRKLRRFENGSRTINPTHDTRMRTSVQTQKEKVTYYKTKQSSGKAKKVAGQNDSEAPEHAGPVRLLKGNSDPFDTFAIAVTPGVNSLVAYIRDVAIPSIYFNRILCGYSSGRPTKALDLERSPIISSPSALRNWQQVKYSLNDECAALACLGAYASLMARATPGDDWACQVSPQDANPKHQTVAYQAGAVTRPSRDCHCSYSHRIVQLIQSRMP